MSDHAQSTGVDFHCHLDLYPDFEAAIAKAEAARIYTLTVTTTPKAWPRNHALTRGTRYVRAALGLHPQLVAERAGELALWELYLPETRYIGEVGLDASPRFYKSLNSQKQVFRTILERSADVGGKIITVHSVRCVPMVLEMVERHLPRNRGVVVLHWLHRNQGRGATCGGPWLLLLNQRPNDAFGSRPRACRRAAHGSPLNRDGRTLHRSRWAAR